MSAKKREQLLQDLAKYKYWKNTQSSITESFAISDLNDESLPVDPSETPNMEYDEDINTQKTVLGTSRAETEDFILTKYALKEAKVHDKNIERLTYGDKGSNRPWTKPKILKLTKSSLPPPKTFFVLKNVEKKIESERDIPGYFESPEGRGFVEAREKEIRERAESLRKKEERKARSAQKTTPHSRASTTERVSEASRPVAEEQVVSENPLTHFTESAVYQDAGEEGDVFSQSAPDQGDEGEFEPVGAQSPQRASNRLSIRHDPITTNIFGSPRSSKLRRPSFLSSSKAKGSRNHSYISVEGDTRRTLRTASTAPLLQREGREITLGTFELIPGVAKFGLVPSGQVYALNLTLINVGLDSSRFRLKPTKSPCLSVHYRKGPVAPGMNLTLEVRLDARLCTLDLEAIREDLQIVTETEFLNVPVIADVRSKGLMEKEGRGELPLRNNVRLLEVEETPEVIAARQLVSP